MSNKSPFEIDHNPPVDGVEFGTLANQFNLYSWMRKVKPRVTPGFVPEVTLCPASVEEPAILSWDYTTPDDIQKAAVARHLGQASPVVLVSEPPKHTGSKSRRSRKKVALPALPAGGG